jgi:hypothetical protein
MEYIFRKLRLFCIKKKFISEITVVAGTAQWLLSTLYFRGLSATQTILRLGYLPFLALVKKFTALCLSGLGTHTAI